MANTTSSRFTIRVQQQTASLIRAIERIHEEESGVFVTRADNISRENDRLRKELYDLQQRIKILTERLGFENLDCAEESLNDKFAGVIQEHKVAVGKINALTSELESAKTQLAQEQAARAEEQQLMESLQSDYARRKQAILDAQSESERDREALGRLKSELQSEWQKSSKLESRISTYRKDNERLTSECEELKSALAKDRVQRLSLGPETPLRGPTGVHLDRADLTAPSYQHPSGLDDISSLPLDAQIAHLRRQYDELLSSKERLSEKYAKDLADWAMFKEKYRGSSSSAGKGLVVSESGIKTRRRVAKQAKDSPTPAARTTHPRIVPIAHADDDVFIKQEESSFAPEALPPLQKLQLNPASSSLSTSGGATPAISNTDTQDSQSVSPAVPVNGQGSKETVSKFKLAGQKLPSRPDITAMKQGSQSDNEGSLLLRKLSHVNAAPPLARSLSSPAESPHRPKDLPRRPKLLGKRKAFAFDGENDSSDDDLVLAPMLQRSDQSHDEREAQMRALRRKSGPQAIADYQQFKGRGRYAVASKAGDKTINSEFEINPAHNEGMAFEFDSVVRDKNERKKLTGGDCIACKEYYEAVGAMPARPGAPLWRSPPPEGSGPSSRPHSCKHKGMSVGPAGSVPARPSGDLHLLRVLGLPQGLTRANTKG
ncbi:unnamed protein product [Rhizoctonia solani]|uniref:DNA endonuclease activator Ctp1 C-terminal domain-containing protein n=1 Tax=Rhizoctonia solani TaxID=456999 RepID=A0A8H2XDC9_9AGAM|nr:unnamed protein product [Rhizoctonia solani]